MQTKALYVHIPFCKHICSYCDFAKVFYNEKIVKQYLITLKKEIEDLDINFLDTLYIGGGTPSSLSLSLLEELFEILKPYVRKDIKEYTIEVNPETINEDKIKLMSKYHINRLSIGVQTFNEDILKEIERCHNTQDILNTISLAKKYQIDNISIDLMYGLPSQSKQDIINDINFAMTLDIKHISYYSLILEEKTKIYHSDYKELDEDTENEYTDYIYDELKKYGFYQYEVSNFAKEGYESVHNKVYWHYDNYYGVGVGASGKVDNEYIEHSKALFKYIKGENIKNITVLNNEESMFNHIMMSLRLVEGLNINEFENRYNVKLFDIYKNAIDKNINNGNLLIDNGYLKTTRESLKYLNSILIDFLD